MISGNCRADGKKTKNNNPIPAIDFLNIDKQLKDQQKKKAHSKKQLAAAKEKRKVTHRDMSNTNKAMSVVKMSLNKNYKLTPCRPTLK